MSKRAGGVKRGVHNIAFWVSYALGRTLHLGASKTSDFLQSSVVQVNGFVVYWCWAEVFYLQGGPVEDP
jgi:hypothetical protein